MNKEAEAEEMNGRFSPYRQTTGMAANGLLSFSTFARAGDDRSVNRMNHGIFLQLTMNSSVRNRRFVDPDFSIKTLLLTIYEYTWEISILLLDNPVQTDTPRRKENPCVPFRRWSSSADHLFIFGWRSIQ